MKRFDLALSLLLLLFTLITWCSCSEEIKVIQSLDEIKKPANRARLISRLPNSVVRAIFLNASRQADIDARKKLNMVPPFGLEGNEPDIFSTSGTGTKTSRMVNKLANVALKASRMLIDSNPPSGYSNQPQDNYQNVYQNSESVYDMIGQYQVPEEFCPNLGEIYCDFSYPYRTMDGSCNSKVNPWWGKKETPYKRLLHPIYNDAINEPRYKSINGKKLKNARAIAMKMGVPKDRNLDITNLVGHFTQFLAHDISFSSVVSDEDGNPIKCFCSNEDTDCMSIPTPADDQVNHDQRCMATPRSSASFTRFDCNLGAREQLNLLTHWLDLSQTYGNDLDKTLKLRLMEGGQLRASVIKGIKRSYLPFNREGKCTLDKKPGKACFEAGDPRVNQNLLLVSMQTIWLREHNRVAKHLFNMNPSWEDEKLFQEARKIVIAEYQHIIYNELLPVILGEKIANLYHLRSNNQDYLYKYNENIYPNAANEFSVAALRFGHSLVRPFVHKAKEDLSFMANISLANVILNSDHAFKKGGIDALIRGTVVDRANSFDTDINKILNDHLFEKKATESPTHRFSLAAMNINRGRDHGIQPYNKYRELCGLNLADSFDDLHNVPKDMRKKLASLYEYVHDIDLFVGGTSENPVQGGIVGPTFACIIAKQFRDLKYGDRFFYENGEDPNISFTIEQLDEIRKSNMARILCDNADISFVQKNPFIKNNHELNPLISCNRVPRLSYKPWKVYY